MRYRCSWCIGYGRNPPAEWQDTAKLPPGLEPGTVSHGICKLCAAEADKQLAELLKKDGKKGDKKL